MLINLRNALMTGKRLPYDAEIAFLESTGTQYIDTGVRMRNFLSFDAVYMTRGKSVSSQAPFCCVYGAYNPQNINVASVASIQKYSSGNLGNRYMDKSITIDQNNYQKITVEHRANDSFWLEYDGVRHDLGAFNSSQSAESPVSIQIFNVYYQADPDRMTPMRLYSFRISDNGVLVRDYIPVRKGTVGYLYDRVSGKLFGNAGTGDFVLGQDVVPVEYIESHGTEYIDTGVYGDLDTVAEFRAAATANDAFYPLFGARISYYQKALAVYNGSDVGYKYTASYDNIRPTNLSLVSDVSADVGAWVDFHVGKNMRFGSWQKDTTSYASSFSTLHTLCLFAWNQNGTVSCGKYKVSYLKIWQNGVLVRDYIPVRVGTDATSWAGAMMDVLTRRIYRNAGTGAFAYGNDLKYPIPAS